MKKQLLAICKNILKDRIDLARKNMDQAQASANEELKSSMGDKYETGRAMMQQEKDKAAIQLAEANNLMRVLDQINSNSSSEVVQAGSIVFTNNGNFFVSAAIGPIEFEGKGYFAISPVSPVGKALLNKKTGDSIIVNSRSFKILGIQ